MIASRVSHILVPIDVGASSELALRYAKRLTATFGASLHLIHVANVGATGASIATYATQHGIDLIVMGINGCTRVATAARNDDAECVVRTAHCPVLVVRDSGAVRVLHARTGGHHANHTH